MQVIQELINLIKESDDLLQPFASIHPHIGELMQECKTNALNKKTVSDHDLQQINYVLRYLHDHLNIGKWDEVVEYKKQAFTCASYVKTLIILELNSSFNLVKNVEVVKSALQVVDKGFLLGLPLNSNVSLLTDCASLLTKYINLNDKRDTADTSAHNQNLELAESNLGRKKLKIEHKIYDDVISGVPIDVLSCPSIELFQRDYFQKEKPVVLKDCLKTWPAMTKWLDINYLLNLGGERTVPIELGSSYSSEDFSQKLMTLREFINKFYNAGDGEEIGYLAQHDLLTQIPELVNDIKIPDYCCLRRDLLSNQENNKQENDVSDKNNECEEDEDEVEPEINAWLGPKGTVSSLHFDPKDNLLCQVYGAKQIIMFAPADTKYLYVHADMPMLSNTSQVDPTKPDLSAFAEFKNATLHSCILQAGEMLYIPPKWWHHVTALEKSFSVNFWWK